MTYPREKVEINVKDGKGQKDESELSCRDKQSMNKANSRVARY